MTTAMAGYKFRCHLMPGFASPATKPSKPLITRVMGAKTGKPIRSARAEPIPPAINPAFQPPKRPLKIITTSPKLKYPPPGTGIRTSSVATITITVRPTMRYHFILTPLFYLQVQSYSPELNSELYSNARFVHQSFLLSELPH